MRLIQKGSVVALVCMVCLSCAVRAQVVRGSKDVGASIAFNGEDGVDGNMHPSYGIGGSYNWRRNLAAVGEFEYVPFGATPGQRMTIQLVGGGARYYFKTSPHLAPYVTATGGFARIATNTIDKADSTFPGKMDIGLSAAEPVSTLAIAGAYGLKSVCRTSSLDSDIRSRKLRARSRCSTSLAEAASHPRPRRQRKRQRRRSSVPRPKTLPAGRAGPVRPRNESG